MIDLTFYNVVALKCVRVISCAVQLDFCIEGYLLNHLESMWRMVQMERIDSIYFITLVILSDIRGKTYNAKGFKQGNSHMGGQVNFIIIDSSVNLQETLPGIYRKPGPFLTRYIAP